METVQLDLGSQSYNICIGAGLIADDGLIRAHVKGRQAFVVSNLTVADHYLDTLLGSLDGLQVDTHLMPDGEQHKNLQTLETIIGDLLAKGHNRSTTIIALGGGVVGDTAGFVAATYQRGVPFIQVPTTLLSQVDSSVGGKTAVNHAAGKNMIGAFYQPEVVVIDIATLATLPEREMSAGLAEVIKHGILADAGYFNQVEGSIDALMRRDEAALVAAIRGSCEIKAAVVAEDEKESGRRALLNFGHTFGHAIETGLGYGRWLHGEAVGVGLIMAADLSLRLGRCSAGDALRIRKLVQAAGLPTACPEELDPETMLALMARDKKATDKGLRFILLDGGIGSAKVVDSVPQDLLMETLKAGSELCSEAS